MISKFLLPCIYSVGVCASAIPVPQQILSADLLSPNADLHILGASGEYPRQLSGRFLHITDFHLDPHYKAGSSEDKSCHHKKGSAGPFGAEGSDCDSPPALINETFAWIERNLKGKIDFVVWTGDSARHDNDEKIPRTIDEVLQLNDVLAGKFIELFGDSNAPRGLSIPIVPTIGNNDIMPHNIFKDGPNRWTKKLGDIWDKFIPEHERHTFAEGGWFTMEVVPNKLVVISLNTMYFYESNSAVDGCEAESEPGYEHMEWLRVQLELLRARHMKAILIGHVPPARAGSKRNWDETCWQKYTLWVNRFRDVVVGSIYGHMNLDHFILQDSHKVKILDSNQAGILGEDVDFSIQSRSNYLSGLREDWSKMPFPPDDMWVDGHAEGTWDLEDTLSTSADDVLIRGKKKRRRQFLKKIDGPFAERYSMSLVSPSIVPNYFPTLRVIEYNISGLEDTMIWADTKHDDALLSVSSQYLAGHDLSEELLAIKENMDEEINENTSKTSGKKNNKNKNKKKKQPKFKVPEPPSPTAPPGPAYSNQPLSWLSYAQYYANLTMIYDELNGARSSIRDEGNEADQVDLYQLEYNTKEDVIYKMEDLTVLSYFKLATRIANKDPRKGDVLPFDESDDDTATTLGDGTSETITKKKKKKHKNRVWKTFVERAFVGLLGSDELDDIEY